MNRKFVQRNSQAGVVRPSRDRDRLDPICRNNFKPWGSPTMKVRPAQKIPPKQGLDGALSVDSWAEHLRQHERQTHADRKLERRLRRYVVNEPKRASPYLRAAKRMGIAALVVFPFDSPYRTTTIRIH